MVRALILALCLLLGKAVQADVAVLIGNPGYDARPDIRAAEFALSVDGRLADAGFDVLQTEDADVAAMAAVLADAAGRLDPEDRLLIFLAGQFVSDGDDLYLLAPGARDVSLFNLGAQGLALRPVLALLARYQGRAVLLLGQDTDIEVVGAAGAADLVAPNGVAIVSGPTEVLARRVARRLVGTPGATLRGVFDGRGIDARGYLPVGVPFLGNGDPAGVSEEDVYWSVVKELNSEEGYLAYVRRFPTGRYLAVANTALGALRGAAENAVQAAEAALGLTRDARREVQRNLALLSFNPRGIDGIFGRGTRAAIAAWQGSRGFDETGYLSANQLSALTAQAEARAAVLEAEAEARRAADLRRDRALWVSLGADPSADELRDYLRNFPDGQFSEIAQAQLDDIEAAERAAAQAQDRADWDAAVAANSIDAYRQYLRSHPQGAFAATAQDRIRAAQQPQVSATRVNRDRAQEAQITQLQITRVLIEQRLRQKGQNPGAIDGRFTQETRRAIRRFQRDFNIPVTGFVGQDTAVALLSG